MAYASPGTDTSTDLDTDEKNQMVLTVLKTFFLYNFVDGHWLTNVNVTFHCETHHKFDTSRTWKVCDNYIFWNFSASFLNKKPPDGFFSILMLLQYPLVEASYSDSWYILILFTYQLELGQLASLAASGSGDKSKDKLGEKVFKLYMLTEGIIYYITYFSFYRVIMAGTPSSGPKPWSC